MEPIKSLEKYLGFSHCTGRESLFYCPFCKHHKRKLSVNKKTFNWKCWVCNKRGKSIFSLLWSLSDKSALQDYRRTFTTNIYQPENKESFKLQLPSEYVPIHKLDSLHKTIARSYLRKRNLSEQSILHNKIGFCADGDYSNRVVLPSFDKNGILNFYTCRSTLPYTVKYVNPATPPGYKNTIIINELNIDWRQPVIIVEGFFDMLKIPNSIPLFSNSLHEDSYLFTSLVLKAPAVYVCLDSDARKQQLQIMSLLAGYDVKCYDMQVSPYKDIGEAPNSYVKECIESSMILGTSDVLRQKIRNARL